MNDTPPTPYIDAREFKDYGYLQEVNRQFLHPLGLALATYTNDTAGDESRLEDAAQAAAVEIARQGHELERILNADECGHAAAKAILELVFPAGAVWFAGVFDLRHDPEGYYFDTSDAVDFALKALRVEEDRAHRDPVRRAALGYVIQPVPDPDGDAA